MAKRTPSKRTPGKHDPYQQREAEKYENPIPSREYILEVLAQSPGPMTHEALCDVLALTDDDSIEALRRRLIAMSRDGQLISNRKRGFGLIDKMDLIRGRIQGHKDGFGFLIPFDGGDDLYLSFRQMRKVFDGDEVLVRKMGRDVRGRREAHIVEVLAHNTNQIVGRLFLENGIYFVRPDNPRLTHDVILQKEDIGGASKGQFVVAEVTQQPGRNNLPTGKVMDVLGDHMAPGMEIDVAIRAHGIPHLWPSDVQAEAEQLPAEVANKDKSKRVDLRHLPFVTIDGEDARDFDDAVYCETKKSGGWRLYVAIADVSHYVGVGSALDREAQVRGNSVYFPDFVVPMLPEALSNGLCSLNPQVDRLCMVCEMTISEAGRVSGYKFYEGVIHSHARLTYTTVGQMLEQKADKNSGVRKAHHALVPHIDELHNLYGALRAARTERGAIDFETVETRILFDEQRKISRIVPTIRNDAHKLIEECMLCANVCAARFLERHELPSLYRVHEGPRSERLENLREFLGELGMGIRGGDNPKPSDYQTLLQSLGDRPDKNLIQTVMLRSLSQAVYQPDNKGHFGLGYTAYAHFTSPIRRYPDLLVHRAIRHVIRSRKESSSVVKRAIRSVVSPGKDSTVQRVKGAGVIAKAKIYPYEMADILALGEQSSLTERRADEATRDVVSWLKCEYLQDHVGDEFAGMISAVTSFGLFVELKDLYVEGLIHITNLPHDYYHYDEAHHRLIGERTRRMFRLGDELKVRVARVDLDDRKVDFEFIEQTSSSKSRKKVSPAARMMAEEAGAKTRGKKPAKGPRSVKAGNKTAKAIKGSLSKSKTASANKKRKPKPKSSNGSGLRRKSKR
ncbi:MAG: ribonuclease R [Candidatus Pelagadaptatus aseana]|uniref:ribonuclease R n=1 Tax=Candidatus Pelagadaptatus aseana TaxID=3120508 RepID=UPI0039B304FE